MFWNQYPYINLNDLNLDFLLKAIGEMKNEVTNFVSINAIKYADPIQWDITRQYEKNTIVIDPVTGTAYISVAPVPVGVALTRPEYWTVVFDLQSFVTKANQNLANNYEEQTTTTATMNTAAGAWVIWGDVLYKALVNITAGDAYVVGSNIERITIEDVIKAIAQEIADEVQARQDAITNAILNNVGNLANLTTDDKSNTVAAINELKNDIDTARSYDFADIRNYGGVADGTTDCTQAFINCMAENNVVYLPNYNNQPYVLGGIELTTGQSIIGDEGTTINTTATDFITIKGNNVEIRNLIINTSGNVFYIDTSTQAISFINIYNIYTYGANKFLYDNSSASHIYTNLYVAQCACRQHVGQGVNISKGFAFIFFDNMTVDCVGVVGTQPCFTIKNNAGCHLTRCEAEGGYSDGTHQTHGGFNFDACQAVWLERCMADTVDSTGFNFNNCQYIYMVSCVSSLCGGSGIGLLGTTTKFALITNCLIAGRKGMESASSGSHGIFNYGADITISNLDIFNMTGYAVADFSRNTQNHYNNINIHNCDRSFVASNVNGGGGVVNGIISDINDVPAIADYKVNSSVFNNVEYGRVFDTTTNTWVQKP